MKVWIVKLLGLWLAVTALGSVLLGAGCAKMLGEGATIDDQLKFYDGMAQIAQRYNATLSASVHVGGDPEAYAKTSVGLDTTLSGQVTLGLVADDARPPPVIDPDGPEAPDGG